MAGAGALNTIAGAVQRQAVEAAQRRQATVTAMAASRVRGEPEEVTALGLMSGTSLDGIDAAILTTDGRRVLARGPAATFPYPAGFQRRLRSVVGREPAPADAGVVRRLTLLHAEAVRRLLRAAGVAASEITIVGFHGHTVLHRPDLRRTCQIGDGQLLADATGIPVVDDFRSADVAAGGHGAPLVPLFHLALAEDLAKPLAVLNIGGVANVTWIAAEAAPDAQLVAFDTGPGNALLDDWVRQVTGRCWDERGRLARGGRVDHELVRCWLADPYFRAPPPKSLDRNTYARVLDAVRGLSPEDGAATLAAFTVSAVATAAALFPAPPVRWLICGGGRRNAALMAMLTAAMPVPVEPAEAVGWDGDGLEAQAFAFLAVRSLRGLPLSLPSTTGVLRPTTGGRLHHPRRREALQTTDYTGSARTRSR
jgi:anhydro-N-acetylmuramic acid kinase